MCGNVIDEGKRNQNLNHKGTTSATTFGLSFDVEYKGYISSRLRLGCFELLNLKSWITFVGFLSA